MFWECHIVTSSIEKLLDQPNDEIKLQDFLDENDLIQECLNQNKRLLDYLVQKSIMNELIHHIITLPNDNNFRNANIVSELLSGDFQRIQESLLEKDNLDLLYSFLTSNNSTLNPILASFFSRIINTLIIRKTNELINYFKSRDTFKNDFINHLDSTSIIDILYRLISDSGEQRSDTIKWYEDINLIDGLMQQFLITESKYVQINISNLLSEFLRLAFDQPTGIDCDFAGPSLSATIERLLYNRNETNEGSSLSSRLSSSSDDEKKSINTDTEGKLTPLVLAQHILSKSNLEQLFDTLITRPIFIANGCDFLDNILDILSRHMPVPICISLTKDENEQMQINDEGDNLPATKSNENAVNLTNLAKDPLVNIYLTLIEIIPSRLPSLIALLSLSSPPLNNNSETIKYQFINEPLGLMRLNLIKFFSKLIYTISNDYTGDNIYEILNSNRLFHILIDLFLKYIYNNFLHTQVYLIIRLIIHINSISVKQPNDIWTRTSLIDQNQEFSSSSPFHYTNRCSYKLFQSILNPSEVNLFERLLDQYELNIASTKSITTNSSDNDGTTSALVRTRFASPNSGHIAQILRCLRDHASIFNNYSTFFKSNDQQKIDDDTNVLEIRWQTGLDYLNEDEKKWSAMHHNDRLTNNFRLNSGVNYLIHTNNLNDSGEANQRRQTFHIRSFGTSGTPYVDDEDDDDEIERFDIDDELMKNDQTTNERKVSEMKKISFEPQFSATFNEQSLWYQQDDTAKDNEKMTSAPTLPDLFENHRNQQGKPSTESNFEQLCSLRANDNSYGLFPFQSSSTIRDEAASNDDVFWQNQSIYLINSNENLYSKKSPIQSTSSSSEEDIDVDDEEESKIDTNIPDDEKFFVHTDMETNKNIQPNNMMDIFRRQSSNTNETTNINNNSNDDNIFEKTETNTSQVPILSSTPERHTDTQDLSDEQQNGEMNSDDDDDDRALQNNFSFLIAKDQLINIMDHNGCLTFLADFRALFIKMFLLAKRSVGQTIAELILSCTFLGLLLALRYVFDRNYNSSYQISRFRPQDSMLFNGLTGNTTYYYPANPCTLAIVTNTISGLSSRWSSFPTTVQTLSNPNIDSLSNTTQQAIYAFIYFTNLDSCTSPSTMPDQVTYTLRMQENGQYTYHAETAKIDENDYLWKRAPEDFCQDKTATANYTNQFLGVQFFIDLSIIQYATGITQDPSSIYLDHFGCPAYYDDEFHSTYAFFIPILISLIFITPFVLNIGYIVEERQNKTKEYLRIFGLRTWINNLVWVTRLMCIYIVLTSIVTGFCMLVLPSSGATQTSVSKAMFNYTNWTLIWTILFIYSIELSTFSVFFSQLFKRPLLAKFLSFILWVLTFIDFYPGAPIAVRYIMCLFPNTGLLFCMLVVQQYERQSVQMITFAQLYSNIFDYPLYIGVCLLMMIIYSFIYMLLAVYVERINPGEFGVAQPWYFVFKKMCSKQTTMPVVTPFNSLENHGKRYITANTTNHWIDSSPVANGIRPSICTINLTKKFGKFKAVSDVSFQFYMGEVCSLLGHNGAGKTTITFILVGMLEPTSGNVIVEGFDYRTNSEEIRKMIGFCPQCDILYDLLSVEEHLKLMGQMRHMNKEAMNASIDRILDLIGLAKDRCTLSKDLSGGMKRRLSIGIALVGDPQVLILDEPTSGIDPPNRRLIWTIIRKMKDAGKCVILTTHFLEEADILSDRIAIMANGRLQASGTPNFLKQQAEFEYQLFIEKQETCNTENITRFIQEYVPDVLLERETSLELVYGIKRGASQYIGQLIGALDEQRQYIAINSYGLSMTTIEEIFLRLVQEEEEENDNINHCSEETRRRLARNLFSQRYEHTTGTRLFWTRLWALTVKRWILSRRQVLFLVGFFFLPIFLEIIIVAVLPTPNDISTSILQNRRYPDAQIQLIPSIYNPHTIVTYSNNNGNNAQTRLINYLTGTSASIYELLSNTIISYVPSQWTQSEDNFVNTYQLGFALFNNLTSSSPSLNFDAFFSTVNYHEMATGLGVAATNLFQFYANSSSKMIVTTNQPILTSSGSLTGDAYFFELIYCFDTIPVALFNFMNGIIASIFISILSLHVIRERISRAKNLQLLTGLSKFNYWFSNAFYDFILCLLLCSLLTVIVKIGAIVRSDPAAEVHVYNAAAQTGFFFFMLALYSLSSLPFIYVYSLIPKTESVGLILYVIVNIILCFLDMVLGFVVVFLQGQTVSAATSMTSGSVIMTYIRLLLSIIFPTVNLKHALFNINLRSSDTCISAVNSILGTSYSSQESWMSINVPGLGIPVIIFFGQMIGWWLVIMLIEQSNRICQRRSGCCHNSNLKTTGDDWNDWTLDEDVRNERQMIVNKSVPSTSAVVVIQDLVQTFMKRKDKAFFQQQYTAVDHLSFYVPQGSCFGLLGTNGAGKTTTFRVLINDIKPTSGDISIRKINHSEIGFCPQFDWLVDYLDVTETLTLFARLKGLPSADIPDICNKMIQLFGLDTYENRQVQKLSGGNKRKVSAALAFMANPTLIFLDEPTTGLDAAAKRKLWNVIRTARDVGLTIIMTSHSMEECEALCTKIGIMKLGQFVCLGSLQRLKNRFGHGYAAQVKVPINEMNKFKNELLITLPGIEIEEQYNGMLYCNVPISSLTNHQRTATDSYNLADVFTFFNYKKEQNEIESYSITQTTLEQIFVRLAGQDEDMIPNITSVQ